MSTPAPVSETTDREWLTTAQERADRAWAEIAGLCDGTRRWTMRVPVNEARDSDTVIAAALHDGERAVAALRRVLDALDEVAAYAREITDQLKMPEAEYGPSEWRLHGDARGHRLAVSEIRRALGDQP